ncbi:DUF4178 domain-containing protein [Cytobacillus sp. Sa5YUA1]|uniref:DUF4178 domain-containing protein n=1 Tax=Cytobacillus stercorigallinarum TaxID=2762240 RepID=A0ABR8QS91_9BACI|nr:DUF4178 domain-containing protein [Cytobacillus stercorigallinarum]MBD7938307.1 DUF4178 domain-containing protein [Cytobacillus stercorigallinarum]
MSFFSKLFGQKKSDEKPLEKRNMFNLQQDDIVTYNFEDYRVVGKINYNDHGFKWHAYQLSGINETLWLSVEMDDELYLGMYKKIKLPLKEPIAKEIEYDGIIYFLDEKGTAKVTGAGRSENLSGLTCHYFDFADEEEENFLSIEKWGSELEVSKGYTIEEYELKIIAGS